MDTKYLKKRYKSILIIAANKKQHDVILDALNLIRKKDKHSFKKVLRCLKIIFVPTTNGHLSAAYEKERMWIVEGGMLKDNQVSFIASSIIHETHHVSQYLSGHKYRLPNSEISALNEQKKFLKKIRDNLSLDWLEKELKRKWWKSVVGNKKSTKKLDNYLKEAEKLVEELKKLGL